MSVAKRKVDDIISALDDAVDPPRPAPSTRPPLPRPRPSIHSRILTSRLSFSKKPTLNAKLKPKSKTNDLALALDSSVAVHFRPSSLPSLLDRLSTFTLATYPTKPAPIDTVAAALCGWESVSPGKDRLRCPICEATWSVSSTTNLKGDTLNQLVEMMKGAFVQKHEEGCPWRLRQCSPDLYTLPLGSPSTLLADIVARAWAIDGLTSQRLQVKHPVPKDSVEALLNTTRSYLTRTQRQQQDETGSSSNGSPQLPQPPSDNSVLTAMFGWELKAGTPPQLSSPRRSSSMTSIRSAASSRASTPLPNAMDVDPIAIAPPLTLKTAILKCKMCHRRIGLWAYVSPPSTEAPDPPNVSPSKILDLTREHRSFCAYVVSTPTSSPKPPASYSELSPAQQMSSTAAGSEHSVGYQTLLDACLRYGLGDMTLRRSILGLQSLQPRSQEAQPRQTSAAKATANKEVLGYVRRLLGAS